MASNLSRSFDEEKKPAISYWAKEKMVCPVCKGKFSQEVMHQGGGRTIAGNLTDELHRLYEPSKKYGRVYPIIYDVGCCPECNTALLWKDFKEIKDGNSLDRLYETSAKRKAIVENIFPHYDLRYERTLYEGAAMYYLALLSYEQVDLAYAPTFKRAMISLRLAWICNDLESVCPGHNFNVVAQAFYNKALYFYQQTLVNETGRIETIGSVSNFGPDTDKNYGYDGIIYLSGLLEYKYGQRENQELRLKKLDESKKAIARIFGLGKSSKSKPGPLLEVARNLYENIKNELSSNNIFEDDDE
ncbi:MAG: DUF2225 domain-containing protein [Treponema sp.]|nr:DUF2225 domain-containing protein [Treponema sp.]